MNVTQLEGPAGQPPPGVIPNFDNPTTIYPWVLFTFVIQWVLVTLALAMRLFTRWHILKVVVVEDFLLILACAGENVPAFWLISGNARHMWDVRLMDFFQNLYYLSIAVVMYGIAITCIKVAILLQFIRLFVPKRQTNPVLFWGSWACIVAATVFYVVIIPISGKLCLPKEKFYNPVLHRLQGAYCASDPAIDIFFASGIFNIFTDFVIFFLPMPAIFKLKMRLGKKIAIASLFATGLFACIASIVRTYYTWRIKESADKSWNICIMGVWTWAEFGAGVLVFCLPVYPKFYRYVEEKIHSRRSTSSSISDRSITPETNRARLQPGRDAAKVRVVRSFTVESTTVSLTSGADDSSKESATDWKNDLYPYLQAGTEHV